MKTKDFIKKVEDFGFKIHETDSYIYVTKTGESGSVYIAKTTGALNTEHFAGHMSEELMRVCVEYVMTPIDERDKKSLIDRDEILKNLKKKRTDYMALSLYFDDGDGYTSYSERAKAVGNVIEMIKEADEHNY